MPASRARSRIERAASPSARTSRHAASTMAWRADRRRSARHVVLDTAHQTCTVSKFRQARSSWLTESVSSLLRVVGFGLAASLRRRGGAVAEEVAPALVEFVEGPTVLFVDCRLDTPARDELDGATADDEVLTGDVRGGVAAEPHNPRRDVVWIAGVEGALGRPRTAAKAVLG